MTTQFIPCVCGKNTATGNTDWIIDGIQIVECSCGVRRVYQIDDAYTDRYESGSYHAEDRSYDTGHLAHAERYEHDYRVAELRLKLLRKVLRTTGSEFDSILDIGCSNGAFVKAGLDDGWNAFGCDLSLDAAFRYIDTDRIRKGTIGECGWNRRSFDVITFNDVLEHIPDPLSALKTARGILKRTGMLVVDIPDMGCGDAIEQGPKFKHVKPHEHLWYWTASQLRDMLESNGFTVVSMKVPIPGKVTAYAMVSAEVEEIEILGPPGVGDIMWTLSKLKGIREREEPCRIKYVVCIAEQTKLATRAKDFLLLCDLIDSIEFRSVPLPRDIGNADPALSVYELIANDYLEPSNGIGESYWLEDWRPELSTDWDIHVKIPECALQQARARLGDGSMFAVFYLSSMIYNQIITRPDWTPRDYAETFIKLAGCGIKPVIIGADWDSEYADEVAAEIIQLGHAPNKIWINTVGRTPIALAMAYMSLANVTVGIANGLPMIATYFKYPSIILWPEKGVSKTRVQWMKRFQTNWMSPEIRKSGLYKPLVVGTFTPTQLAEEVLAMAYKKVKYESQT